MSVWARHVFPRIYDPTLAWSERRGMRERRRRLLGSAAGRTLEIGAGTGLNVPLYPAGVDELVLAEPELPMARLATRRLVGGRIEHAPAEALPFADGSFDTVVSTLVLCTVDDLERSLLEIRRVLKPDGQLLFLEHVRADPGSQLAAWQDRLHDPWRAFAAGCHCNREIVEAIGAGPFAVDRHERAQWRGMPPIVRPLAAGRARPA